MNIMLLTRLFPPSSGGIESYIAHLFKELSKKNKVCVLTTGKYVEKNNKFKVYRLDGLASGGKTNEEYLLFKKDFKKILLDEKIDIVHSHNLLCFSDKDASFIINVLDELKVPLVDQCHDVRQKNLNSENVNKNFVKIIAVSNFAKRKLILTGYSKDIIEVVHNGIDSDFFDPQKFDRIKSKKYFDLPVDKKIILFPSRAIRTSTGKFGNQKNFMTLAQSAKYIKKEFGNNFLIVFPINVGSKENVIEKRKTMREFKRFIESEGVENNFFVIKRKIGFAEMPILYRTSDVVCTPSENEAFGLVFLEAMLMEIIPIGARSGAVPEIIDDGKTGFLIDVKDYKKLAKIISEILANDEKRIQMGKVARKIAIDKFSFKDMVKKIVKIYKDVIEITKKEINLVK